MNRPSLLEALSENEWLHRQNDWLIARNQHLAQGLLVIACEADQHNGEVVTGRPESWAARKAQEFINSQPSEPSRV